MVVEVGTYPKIPLPNIEIEYHINTIYIEDSFDGDPASIKIG